MNSETNNTIRDGVIIGPQHYFPNTPEDVERRKNAGVEHERVRELLNAWYHDDGTPCLVAIEETREALRKLGGL